MNDDGCYYDDGDMRASAQHARQAERDKLARVLTEARKNATTNYLRAVEDIAKAMGLTEVTEVRYTA